MFEVDIKALGSVLDNEEHDLARVRSNRQHLPRKVSIQYPASSIQHQQA